MLSTPKITSSLVSASPSSGNNLFHPVEAGVLLMRSFSQYDSYKKKKRLKIRVKEEWRRGGMEESLRGNQWDIEQEDTKRHMLDSEAR